MGPNKTPAKNHPFPDRPLFVATIAATPAINAHIKTIPMTQPSLSTYSAANFAGLTARSIDV
jgi:hypothetical protein